MSPQDPTPAPGPASGSHAPVETETTKRSWRSTYLGVGDGVDATNVSWGAIFAGIVTTIAILIAFSLLGTAIGLGVTDPTSDQPFQGVGTGLAIWAILTLAIAIAAGGFVTGVLAGRAGFIHGVVTWAGSIITAAVVVSMATSAALGAVGAVFSTTASAVGSGASAVGSVVTSALGGATDQIADAVSDIDTEEIQAQTEDILIGTGVPELQPGYLQEQVEESQDEILEAGRAVLSDPDQYEQILSDLASSLSERAETIEDAVDREAIANSVAENTDLTGAEAEELTNGIADGLETAAETVSEELSTADEQVQQLQTQVTATVEQARETADEVTDSAAAVAGWAFAGTLIALAISAFAGLLGARLVDQRPARAEARPV